MSMFDLGCSVLANSGSRATLLGEWNPPSPYRNLNDGFHELRQQQAHIRQATIEDAPSISNVHVTSWRETYAGIMSPSFLAGLSMHDSMERWRTRLDDPNAVTKTFVVESGGEVVGFSTVGLPRHNIGTGY
jgi:hypothetical protein